MDAFEGYAIGGTSVGETKETMYKMIDYSLAELPKESVKYLMGVEASMTPYWKASCATLTCLTAFCRPESPDTVP